MSGQRPPFAATASVLTIGSTSSAAALAVAFLAGLLGAESLSSVLATAGIVALIATPAVGLMATWLELRRERLAQAWLAVVVLLVLFLATIVAVAARV